MEPVYLDRRIRYFLKIAELSSFSRAAEELGLTQPGLSRQLGALESFLRKPLFIRTGRGVRLTDAGERLRLETKVRYEQIDAAIASVRDKEGITEGNLRIATIHTLGSYFVSDLLAEFIRHHGRVNLSVTAGGSPDVVELVEKGKADIGFVYDSAVASKILESTPLFDDNMCLIVHKNDFDGIAMGDLCAEKFPLVGFPETYALRRMLKSAGLNAQVVAEANTLEAILRLVSSGIGRCILPDRISNELLAEYSLVKTPLIAPVLSRRVVAIVRQDSGTTLLSRKLFEMARETANL